MLVRYSLLIDILEPAQNLSLITQRNNLSIIDVVDAVEITKTKYPQLLKKLDEEENFIFTAFPTFKKIVKNIEEDENESGGSRYQGEKIKPYTQEKCIYLIMLLISLKILLNVLRNATQMYITKIIRRQLKTRSTFFLMRVILCCLVSAVF